MVLIGKHRSHWKMSQFRLLSISTENTYSDNLTDQMQLKVPTHIEVLWSTAILITL